jgi:hypothetical protein
MVIPIDDACSQMYYTVPSARVYVEARMSWSFAISTIIGAVGGALSPRPRGDPASKPKEARQIRSEAHRALHLIEEELGEEIQECILRCLDCRRLCLKLVDRYRQP